MTGDEPEAAWRVVASLGEGHDALAAAIQRALVKGGDLPVLLVDGQRVGRVIAVDLARNNVSAIIAASTAFATTEPISMSCKDVHIDDATLAMLNGLVPAVSGPKNRAQRRAEKRRKR